MQKILILVNKTYTNKNSFFDGLKNFLPSDVSIEIGYFEDIVIDIDGKNTSIFIDDKSILDYDLVYFRRAGREFLWLAATIAVYMEHKGKKFFDTTHKDVGSQGTKLTALLKLALAGQPVVPTYFCYKGNIIKSAEKIIEKYNLPIVAKDLYSQRGSGVFLLKSIKDFKDLVIRFPDKKFLFQKLIDKKEEFRILVVGDEIGSFERKTSDDPNEFRNNVSLGAREDFMDINEIPEEIRNISVKSSRIVKIEIAGVDITIDVDGKAWILEVNRGPGFTYLSDKSHEVANVADYFVRELRKIK